MSFLSFVSLLSFLRTKNIFWLEIFKCESTNTKHCLCTHPIMIFLKLWISNEISHIINQNSHNQICILNSKNRIKKLKFPKGQIILLKKENLFYFQSVTTLTQNKYFFIEKICINFQNFLLRILWFTLSTFLKFFTNWI